MIFDCTVSSLALVRYVERNTAIDAWIAQKESSELTQLEEELDKNALTDFLDTHFDDQRMERIYPNAKMVDK
jgi:hypothetical protein